MQTNDYGVTIFDEDAGYGVNLDCEAQEDLVRFAALVGQDPEAAASVLFPKQPLSAARPTCAKLAAYARKKAAAMECRSNGLIERALRLEDQLQVLYGQLPAFARW